MSGWIQGPHTSSHSRWAQIFSRSRYYISNVLCEPAKVVFGLRGPGVLCVDSDDGVDTFGKCNVKSRVTSLIAKRDDIVQHWEY